MLKFFTPLILAFWVCAIALIAIQNATPITLNFLILHSIQMPLGLVLAFSVALGLVGMAIVLPLLQIRPTARTREDFE
jgi:uncharacterized integral membrane protein